MAERELLTAAVIARIMGWSERTARSWLAKLPADRVQWLRSGKGQMARYITLEQLEALVKAKNAPIDERIDRRLRHLEQQIADQEKRIDALAATEKQPRR